MTEDLLAQKELVDSYLDLGERPLSSFSFVSLFAWADFFDFEFKVMEDCLCVFAHSPSGCFLYLPPLGKKVSPAIIKAVFAHMARAKGPHACNRIENIPENVLSAFASDGYNQYAKPAEYVYVKQDLITLKGNAYKSQRHGCNLFSSRHADCSFEIYQDVDAEACRHLYDCWSAGRAQAHTDAIYRAMLEENRLVHGRLLKCWKPLGLTVRVLKAGGRIIGYTFGFALDQDTFCVYAEITDLTVHGAAAYMFRALCADADLKRFSRINTMDDFAMPNVARAKNAYHPSELITSYTISSKD